MNNHYLQLVGAAGPRVDGIDIAQLLHDLGEASAAKSPVDLFALCLTAQRVLTRMNVSGTDASQDESALLAAFRAMDDSARSDMLPVMQSIAEQFPQRSPARLTLVRAAV